MRPGARVAPWTLNCDGFFTVGPYPDHLHRRLTFESWREWGDDVAYFYIYRPERPSARIDLVRDSLDFALEVFAEPNAFAYDGYGVGPRAYDNWLATIERHGTTFGHAWNARVWSECRRFAAEYATQIGSWFPAASGDATRLARTYADLARKSRRSPTPIEGRQAKRACCRMRWTWNERRASRSLRS